MRRTKIVCTLGPSTNTLEKIEELIREGMNVARLNMSHGDYPEHKKRIDWVKEVRAKLGVPVALMLDTKGPEIRLGSFKNHQIQLIEGQQFTLTIREVEGDETQVSVSHKGLVDDVSVGVKILLDDGLVGLEVQEIKGTDILCRVLNGGSVGDHKGVNVPGAHISLPAVTEKDVADIRFGVEMDVDYIAASFVRRASDVMEIRKILEDAGNTSIQIISKIENQQGVSNVDEILRVSDGLMVARGDLGVEIPNEEVPVLQKVLIRRCNAAGKPVITATQMLDSMIRNPRPTRAETGDVANAVLDGTDAVMLSGETAAGKYPIEALKTMAKIAGRVERALTMVPRETVKCEKRDTFSVTNAVSHACYSIAMDLRAAAIITPTRSGSTARRVSKYRPMPCQLIATTNDEHVYHQLALIWGVHPFLTQLWPDIDEMIDYSVKAASERSLVKNGDVVVITAGVPVGVSGTTNLLKVHVVGDVLVRGRGVGNKTAFGRVCVVRNEEDAKKKFLAGDVLVTPMTDNSLLPYIKKASAIVVQGGDLLSHAAVVGLALDIPVILDAENACSVLKDGIHITIDPSTGFIYNGETKTA
ncbi:pyruvate kinase [Gehongia tenuis]|uniref:Pyruvate kinase n=1 Tax=Gehongia tenuis TaxID=2763655 RepID=A0A926D4E8_9FIRM|nr:pyruvate kinase [Gehongia tenuis]MBC8531277.1 pyruvate kinase [Gehongia tenuis]